MPGQPKIIGLLESAYLWMDARKKLDDFTDGTLLNPFDKTNPRWSTTDSLAHAERNCATQLRNLLAMYEPILEQYAFASDKAHEYNTTVRPQLMRDAKVREEAIPVVHCKATETISNHISANRKMLELGNSDWDDGEEVYVAQNPELSLQGVAPEKLLQKLYECASNSMWKVKITPTNLHDKDAEEIVAQASEDVGYIGTIWGRVIEMHILRRELDKQEVQRFNDRHGFGLELVQNILKGMERYRSD